MGAQGWIGVDLDGTLAYLDPVDPAWPSVGRPLQPMLDRVKAWVTEGKDVRIVTARVDEEVSIYLDIARGADPSDPDIASRARCAAHMRMLIERWLVEHVGVALPITSRKDYHMLELWDDRAVQVLTNTGQTYREFLTAEVLGVSDGDAAGV